MTPADIVNLSLGRIGAKVRIGSLYDGSMAAKRALDAYGETRDAVIRNGDYDFARRSVSLTLLKSAPQAYMPPVGWDPTVHPPLPWRFEYAYPADCIKAGSIRPLAFLIPNFDPQSHIFSVQNDGVRTIVTNVSGAILTYAGRVTDPNLWDQGFIEAFVSALARRLAPVLVGMEPAKAEVQEEQAQATLADGIQG